MLIKPKKKKTPRFYQIEAFEAFLHALETTEDNPIIAMPTGTGKSIVIALICERLLSAYPGMRIIMATHVKELVSQNAKALLSVWPGAPVGIFSAGLKSKQAEMPITFCSIQSAAKAAARFGKQHLMLVDEAQALGPSDESNYQKFIAALKLFNPKFRVGGLTATPYRRKGGMLTDLGTFTSICYDITGLHAFNKLIEWGYLIPLFAKPTSFQFDVSQIRMTAGDFNKDEVNIVVNVDEKTEQAIQEAIQVLHDREHIIVFGAGIDHVENITNMLRAYGENAVCVHSKMSSDDRDAAIEAFATGGANGARWIINDGILTTGYDSPWIDGMVDLSPTTSPGLHVQKLGRGTRPYWFDMYGTDLEDEYDLETVEGRLTAIARSTKQNCRYLDFVGNLERLGPINDPIIPGPKKKKGKGELPLKICPKCRTYNFTAARFCCNVEEGCDHEFIFESKIEDTAATRDVVAQSKRVKEEAAEPEYHWFVVDHVEYKSHVRAGQPGEMKVYYHCGFRQFTELLSIEHPNWAGKRAREWWRARLPGYPPPPTTADGLANTHLLADPTHIYVQTNTRWPKIISYSFNGETPLYTPATPTHKKELQDGTNPGE